MLIMALEAIEQITDRTKTISGFEISNASFRAPLIIPSVGAVETQLSLQSTIHEDSFDERTQWFYFRLSSYQKDVWTHHCDGHVGSQHTGTPMSSVETESHIEGYPQHHRGHQVPTSSIEANVDKCSFYQQLRNCGYEYGTEFQPLDEISITENYALATVHLFKGKEEIEVALPSCIIHPATLDGFMHLILALLTKGGAKTIPTFVPTKLKRLWMPKAGLVNHESNPLSSVSVRAIAALHSSDSIDSGTDFSVFADKLPCLVAEGLEWKSASTLGTQSWDQTCLRQLCHQITWKPDLELLTSDQLIALCQNQQQTLDEPVECFNEIDRLIRSFITGTVRQLNSLKAWDIPPHFGKYMEWVQIQYEGYEDESVSNRLMVQEDFDLDTESSDQLCMAVESKTKFGRLIVTIGKNLLPLLNGELDPLSLLFDDNILRDAYEEMNECPGLSSLGCYLDLLAHQNPRTKILEVGSGTGATTLSIMKALRSHEDIQGARRFTEYHFTDISPAFFEKAQEIFNGFPGIIYEQLDIERDPQTQGFALETYDLIIAANVGSLLFFQ